MAFKFSENLFLTQTDTTTGLLSQNAKKITKAKQRLDNKFYIVAVDSLSTLNRLTRIPCSHKNRIRRAKKTTFILPNQRSYRLVSDKKHLLFLHRIKWTYSSSANISGKAYEVTYAKEVADVAIYPFLSPGSASAIYKLSKTNRLTKVR